MSPRGLAPVSAERVEDPNQHPLPLPVPPPRRLVEPATPPSEWDAWEDPFFEDDENYRRGHGDTRTGAFLCILCFLVAAMLAYWIFH